MSGGSGDLLSLLRRDETPPRGRGTLLSLTSPQAIRDFNSQLQPMINSGIRIARQNAQQQLQDYVYPILGMEGKADPHEIKKYKPPKDIGKDENINSLSQKIGSSKGRKTNIEINNNEKQKKVRQSKLRNGDFTAEQKWRIYKTKVEPELIDQIVQPEPNQIEQSIKNAFKEFHIPNIKNIVKEAKDNDDLDNKDVLHAKEVLYNDIVNVPIQSTNNEKDLPANFGHAAETDLEKIIANRRLEELDKDYEKLLRVREAKMKAKDERKRIAEENRNYKIDIKEYNREVHRVRKEKVEAKKEVEYKKQQAKNEAEKTRLEEAAKKQQAIVDNYHKVRAQDKIGNAILANRDRTKHIEKVLAKDKIGNAIRANRDRTKYLENIEKAQKKSPTKLGVRGRPPAAVQLQLSDLQKDYLKNTGSLMSPTSLRKARATLSVKNKGPG
jgi:hypothetical protein